MPKTPTKTSTTKTASRKNAPARTTRKGATAETLAAKQREISVSEFFAKNRHLLGFDNPRKALLTTVKEAVDNALDACEEAGILPEITVEIEHLPKIDDGRFRVTVTDNGPGVVRRQVESIFGQLLYGSKFHRLKMSRGQQGIGISAAGMYGLMTTGKPMVIVTKPHKRRPAHHIELAMDTTKNRPEVTVDRETDEHFETSSGTGTQVCIELEARYIKGKTSIDAYLEQTAIANPHAKFIFIPPGRLTAGDAENAEKNKGEDKQKDNGQDGQSLLPNDFSSPHPDSSPGPDTFPESDSSSESDSVTSALSPASESLVDTIELDGRIIFPRTIDELPEETAEIKPHPYGVELGTFLRMLKQTNEKQLGGFFKHEFCRVTPSVASEVYKAASTKQRTITGQTWVSKVDHAAAEKIYKALQNAKLRSPPTNCLSPIGVRQLLAGMLKGVQAEFYAAATRPPAVYRGNPFQIEAAIGFGGDLPGDQQARVIRFANRVPLLYQQSACCAFKSVVETSWRNYGMTQPKGTVPTGQLVIMIHMASVWVPFTSESKEAIADYDEIRKEMKLALQECGRKLNTYVRRRQRMKRESERRGVFERYIGEIAKACTVLNGVETQELYDALLAQAKRRTEIADAQLDEEGKFIKDNGRLDNDDGVIIIDRNDPRPPPPDAAEAPAPSKGKKQRTSDAKPSRPTSKKPKQTTKQASKTAKTTKAAAKSSVRKRVIKKVVKKKRTSKPKRSNEPTLFGA